MEGTQPHRAVGQHRAFPARGRGRCSLAPREQRVTGGLVAALTAVTTAHLGLAARLKAMGRWGQARMGFVEDALLLAGTALLVDQVAKPAAA